MSADPTTPPESPLASAERLLAEADGWLKAAKGDLVDARAALHAQEQDDDIDSAERNIDRARALLAHPALADTLLRGLGVEPARWAVLVGGLHRYFEDRGGCEHNAYGQACRDAAEYGKPALTGPADDPGVLQDDLRAIMEMLGIPTHARPVSPHEVFQQEVLPALASDMARAWAAAEAALPAGWWLYGVRLFRATVAAERYRATAYSEDEVGPGSTREDGYGPTPGDALRNLAAALPARPGPTDGPSQRGEGGWEWTVCAETHDPVTMTECQVCGWTPANDPAPATQEDRS